MSSSSVARSSRSSVARSSRSSPRYAPYSRSPTPASSRRSPLPSPSSGHDAERSSSDNYLSPAHTYHAMPSTSTYQLHHSAHRTISVPSPPAAPLAQAPFSQCPLSTIQPVPLDIHPVQTTQQGQSYYGNGMFRESRDFIVRDSTLIENNITLDNFMKEFLQHTIIGAEFDSSDRHPPPRCHPGTRLAIIERCKNFIAPCDGKEKMRWVVGGAGVGKSAIMQIVAEEIPADASVFFSVNGRNDGTKFFATIAYQLAVKYEPYRQFIQNAINRDPSLLRKSLPAQFRKFIVDPFIHQCLFNDSQRFLIIIDGLDECDDPTTQREILGLISDFCIKYPTSSIMWIVASRPEPHIASFFDDARVAPAYTKEEIAIDSDEACKEVQRYLRDELDEIKLASPALRHKREWPSGLEFTKIATAAGGLFAYASTVVRYIRNSHYRGPVTLLCHVLEVIDEGFKGDVSKKDHPMALLDALYRRILFNIPPDDMINTRKLLLTTVDGRWKHANFRYTCNRLGLSEAAAYDAVSYLHAVLKVPTPDEADVKHLEYFHKSYPDFLLDFERSRFSHNAEDESDQLLAQNSLRIVTQVSDDSMDNRKVELDKYGYLRGCLGFCDKISLPWPGDDRFLVSDDVLRPKLYRDSMANICRNFTWSRNYSSISFFHALTTHFNAPGRHFPIYSLRDRAFEQFRPELTMLGKLKEVPLRTLGYAAICCIIDVRFTIPIGMNAEHFDPWPSSCTHVKLDMNGLSQQRVWATDFCRWIVDDSGDDMAHVDTLRFNIVASKDSHREVVHNQGYEQCLYCSRRLADFFIDHPDQVATVFTDSTEMSYVELSFVDPDDGVSEWRYRFCHSGRPSDIIDRVP